MFEWSDLRHFLAVARSGSTLSASKILGVNQTTVARRVAALEEALGEKLFEKTAGGYRLTEVGSAMVQNAERVETEVESFSRMIAQRSRKLLGMIRVTTNDRQGILALVSGVFTDHKLSIREANCRSETDRAVNVFHVHVTDVKQLRTVMRDIEKLTGVMAVERI